MPLGGPGRAGEDLSISGFCDRMVKTESDFEGDGP